MTQKEHELIELKEEQILQEHFNEDIKAIYGVPTAEIIKSYREYNGCSRSMAEIQEDISQKRLELAAVRVNNRFSP